MSRCWITVNVWAKLKCVWLTINPFNARNAPQHTPRLWPFLYPFKDLMPLSVALHKINIGRKVTKWSLLKETNPTQLDHASYKLSQVLPDLVLRAKILSNNPKAPDLLTFGLQGDPVLTSGGSLFRLSLICRKIPTRSSSTWWFKATDVSMYLQLYVSANFLASVNITNGLGNETC